MKKAGLVLSLLVSFLNKYPVSAQEQIYRWPKDRPIKVFIKPGFAVPGFRPQLQMILMQAFGEWTEASPVHVEFVNEGKDAQITCEWTNDRGRMSSSREDGQAVLVPNGHELTMANIVLLTVPPPSMKTLTDNYASHVALHEVGHALGLGHSAVASDVMYGVIYPDDKVYKLSEHDRNTLIALYNKNLAEDAAQSGAQADSQGSEVKTGSGQSTIQVPTGSSPEMESLRLNNEGAAALQKQNFTTAELKLEAAHKLAPQNRMITGNLGGLDANLGSIAFMMRNLPLACQYFGKAVPLLEEVNSPALMSTLKSYLTVLNITGKSEEAKKIEAKIKQLSGGK